MPTTESSLTFRAVRRGPKERALRVYSEGFIDGVLNMRTSIFRNVGGWVAGSGSAGSAPLGRSWRHGAVLVCVGHAALAGFVMAEPGKRGAEHAPRQGAADGGVVLTPVERFEALMREGQPPDGLNATEEVAAVAAWIRERTKVAMAEIAPGADPRMVSFADIADPPATQDAEAVRVARQVLARLKADGLDEKMARLASCTRWIRESDGSPLLDDNLPQMGDARAISRLNIGRMALAAEANDWNAWLVAFDQSMGLGAMVGREPVLIGHLVGAAIHASGFERARAAIASGHLDAATLERIDAIIVAHPLPNIRRAFEGERCMAMDTLEFVYERGPAALTWLQGGGQGAPPAKPRTPVIKEGDALGPGMPSLREQRVVFHAHYDWLNKRAATRIADRRGVKGGEEVEKNLLLGLLAPAADRALNAWDQNRADRAGMRTLIALERFRLARGAYPETLAELAPGFVGGVVDPAGEPGVLIDPGTGGALGYLPPGKGPYGGGRAFVLYSSGPDGDDDGGAVNFEDPMAVNRDPAEGDFLLNR